MRIESSNYSVKAHVTFTNVEVADKVVKEYKEAAIGKWNVLLRPYANRENYSIFMSGIYHKVLAPQIE